MLLTLQSTDDGQGEALWAGEGVQGGAGRPASCWESCDVLLLLWSGASDLPLMCSVGWTEGVPFSRSATEHQVLGLN